MDITPDTNPDWLDDVEAIAKAATRGPWTWTDHGVPDLQGRGGDPEVHEYDTEVIEADHDGGCGCRRGCELELNISDADKAFIAALNPTAVLGLIAQVRALREQSRRWKAFAMLQKAEADMFEAALMAPSDHQGAGNG